MIIIVSAGLFKNPHSTALFSILLLIMDQKTNLEGDMKIVRTLFLTFSLTKSLIFGVPLCLSIIGIYFLIKFKSFRIKVFYAYSQKFDPKTTTLIFTILNDGSTQISAIVEKQYQHQKHYVFTCKFLSYQIKQHEIFPIGSPQTDRLALWFNHDAQTIYPKGLSQPDHAQRLSYYGYNQHKVQIPNMFYYVLNIITEPIFIMQYIFFVIWVIRGLAYCTVIIMTSNLIIISINYHFLRVNYQKIKAMAEKQFPIRVVRQDKLIEVSSEELVPGDLIKIGQIIPCDCILMAGDLTVNQVNFSGQNLPILKYKLESLQNIDSNCHWLFEGSQVLQSKQQNWAIVIYTGFTSHRGRIIRKIINNSVQEPVFIKNVIYFYIQIFLLFNLIYLGFLPTLRSLDIEQKVVSFAYLLIVSVVVPIGFVSAIHMLPGISLYKLKSANVVGRQPYKVYQSSQIKTIFFDKTGTLTQNSMKFTQAYVFRQHDHYKIKEQQLKNEYLMRLVFGNCHMVKRIEENSLKGDEIDLIMFQISQSIIQKSLKEGVFWQIKMADTVFQVLRVNQFQSKHMSMSVLVRNTQSNQLYVFAKGSPELIYKYSVNECKSMMKLLKQLSIQGLRLIGLGYKQIQNTQLDDYLKTGREKYLEHINIIGIACFANHLKEQAKDTVNRLKFQCGIQAKMLTGDNIYTAIHTALEAAILPTDKKIAVCQAKNITNREKLSIKITQLTFQKGLCNQKDFIVESLLEYLQKSDQSISFAVEDNHLGHYSLLGSLIEPKLFPYIPKIDIFARASPQNKTLVIEQLKQHLQNQYLQLSFLNRIFSSFRKNVCMVGDGANDLMAIQQADIGIALAQTDATFSTDFIVNSLDQIQVIIREGKSMSTLVIQSLLVTCSAICQHVLLFLLMVHDLSSWRGIDTTYWNIVALVPMPFLFALCQPSTQNTLLIPQTNVMALRNQLKYFLNNIVSACAYWYIFTQLNRLQWPR